MLLLSVGTETALCRTVSLSPLVSFTSLILLLTGWSILCDYHVSSEDNRGRQYAACTHITKQ